MGTYFLGDFLAVVPIFVVEILYIYVFKVNIHVLQANFYFRCLYATKLIRFNQLSRIKQQLGGIASAINRQYMQYTIEI